MELLHEELMLKRLDRQHKIIEHEAALRNLDALHAEHFRGSHPT